MLDGPYRYDPSYSPPDPRYIAENGMERLRSNTVSIYFLRDACCIVMKMYSSSSYRYQVLRNLHCTLNLQTVPYGPWEHLVQSISFLVSGN
jgi:hypothetical protein